MSELRDALQRLADRADDTAMPPPSTVRAAGDRRTRRLAVAVAGGTLAAVVVGVTALAALPRTAPDDSQRPADQTSSSGPSPGSASEWDVIEPDWGSTYVSPNAVAARGERFVVVADTSGGDATTPLWWSLDGRTWIRASGAADSANVTDVIATDGGFLATGVVRDGGAAFWSDDGTTWQRAAVDTPRGGEPDSLWGIAETDLGFFAWGFVQRAPRLFRSADGRTWTTTDLAAPPGRDRDTSLCWVADSPTGVLTATGSLDDGGLGRLVRWTSENGSTWTRVGKVSDAEATSTCNRLYERHWSASTDAGTVRIEPYGDVGLVYFRPAE